jgi:hypothetical protein
MHSLLFSVECGFEVIGFGEFWVHVALHFVDLLLRPNLISINSSLKILNFKQIIFNLIFLNPKPSSSSLRLFNLVIFEFKVSFHVFELFLWW